MNLLPFFEGDLSAHVSRKKLVTTASRCERYIARDDLGLGYKKDTRSQPSNITKKQPATHYELPTAGLVRVRGLEPPPNCSDMNLKISGNYYFRIL